MANFNSLVTQIKRWGQDLGFQQVGIADTQLTVAETHLLNWLKQNRHGNMEYMVKHGLKRTRPGDLIPGTLRIISVRMDYFSTSHKLALQDLQDSSVAYISRYALGRDYHKVLRKRLQKLATLVAQQVDNFSYRVFTDSAPVMEKALAEKAGIGWIGKHSNLINQNSGSWFFLGEIYTNLPLPVDTPATNHCGSCNACINACPTKAIVAPYEVDARLCISYLTIELQGSIPVHLRRLIGNRIYGCDDCQLVCPWNKFSEPTKEADFLPRQALDTPQLLTLFKWSEAEFLNNTNGSPIRRIGYQRWLRNIAVALGNCSTSTEVVNALKLKLSYSSAMVKEHIEWAIKQHCIPEK